MIKWVGSFGYSDLLYFFNLFVSSEFSDIWSEIMEDTDEFKWAVKLVLKRQLRDLVSWLDFNTAFKF